MDNIRKTACTLCCDVLWDSSKAIMGSEQNNKLVTGGKTNYSWTMSNFGSAFQHLFNGCSKYEGEWLKISHKPGVDSTLWLFYRSIAIEVNLLHADFGWILKWIQTLFAQDFRKNISWPTNHWPYHKRRFDQKSFNYKLRAVIKWVNVVDYLSRSQQHIVGAADRLSSNRY